MDAAGLDVSQASGAGIDDAALLGVYSSSGRELRTDADNAAETLNSIS